MKKAEEIFKDHIDFIKRQHALGYGDWFEEFRGMSSSLETADTMIQALPHIAEWDLVHETEMSLRTHIHSKAGNILGRVCVRIFPDRIEVISTRRTKLVTPSVSLAVVVIQGAIREMESGG
jgi:hypothetical protein